MTPDQVKWAMKLGDCRFPRGSTHGRFARSMDGIARYSPEKVITPRQATLLEILVFRYRRQVGYTGAAAPDLGRQVKDPDLGLIDLTNVGTP